MKSWPFFVLQNITLLNIGSRLSGSIIIYRRGNNKTIKRASLVYIYGFCNILMAVMKKHYIMLRLSTECSFTHFIKSPFVVVLNFLCFINVKLGEIDYKL